MMKKAILLALALCVVAAAAAQDLIVKRDASKIQAKIVEIDAEVVRYKRFSNLDGPTYVLAIVQVDHILYANGEKEQFAPATPAGETIPATPLTPAIPAGTTIPATPLTPAIPAVSAANLDEEYVLRKYEIGDFYERGGVRGIVCQLSEDQAHGLILSLEELYLPWSLFRKPDLAIVGADDRGDGRVNMERVAQYIADKNLSWDDFPAFKWCRDQGEGWYLPSIDELLLVSLNYNGGSRMSPNRKVRSRINDTLKEHGGKRMDRLVYYFASTELDEKNAYTTHMDLQPPYVVEIPKYNKFIVRAVRRF